VSAWQSNFTGSVVAYGAFPDQGKSYWTKSNCGRKLGSRYLGTAKEGAILAGIREFANDLLTRQWPQNDGPPMQIEICLVDAGGKMADTIYEACRLAGKTTILKPSRGYGITAGRRPFEDYQKSKCRAIGNHWWIPLDSKQAVTHYDTNFWKSFLHARLATATGDPGALTLYGQPEQHRLLCDHLCSEYYVETFGDGGQRRVEEWKQYPGKDNEFFDCLVGCMVGAAVLGCSVILIAAKKRTQRLIRSNIVESSFRGELG
jgi:phage terminase large subunit GpA-like protein